MLKSAHSGTTFQNGVYQNNHGPLTQERLDDQIGSQGRLPICSAILPSQKVHGLSLERSTVKIHVPPFRSEQCTFQIHKSNETNSSNLDEARYQTHPVPRQHAGHGTNEVGGEEAPSHSLGTSDSFGLSDLHEEKCNTPGSGDGVYGFCVGFKQDVHFPTESEVEIPTEDCKQAQSWIRACEAASTGVRNDGSSTSGNPSCTITLQIPWEDQSKSPEKGLSIRDTAGGEPWHGDRFDSYISLSLSCQHLSPHHIYTVWVYVQAFTDESGCIVTKTSELLWKVG